MIAKTKLWAAAVAVMLSVGCDESMDATPQTTEERALATDEDEADFQGVQPPVAATNLTVEEQRELATDEGDFDPLPPEIKDALVAEGATAASCPWPVGHANYCRDCGPCWSGQGDCDNNSECQLPSTCHYNVGATWGLPAHYDVCVDLNCPWASGHPNFCRDCGPCGHGQGDCDNDSECDEHTECHYNVGASYGLPASYDVCVDDCDPAAEAACKAACPSGNPDVYLDCLEDCEMQFGC